MLYSLRLDQTSVDLVQNGDMYCTFLVNYSALYFSAYIRYDSGFNIPAAVENHREQEVDPTHQCLQLIATRWDRHP